MHQGDRTSSGHISHMGDRFFRTGGAGLGSPGQRPGNRNGFRQGTLKGCGETGTTTWTELRPGKYARAGTIVGRYLRLIRLASLSTVT